MGRPRRCSLLLPSWLNGQVAWVQTKMDPIGLIMGNDLIFEVLKDKKGRRGEKSNSTECNSSCHIHSTRQFNVNVAALGAQRWAGVCDYASPSCNNQWTMQESTPRLSQFNLKGRELREKELRTFLCWVDLWLITGTPQEYSWLMELIERYFARARLLLFIFIQINLMPDVPRQFLIILCFHAFHPWWILLNDL